MASITIPESVTTIGDMAFYGCSSLTSITIPKNVTTVGESVFAECSALTTVTFADGITSIADSMFSYCKSITSIIIPDSVTSIGSGAFYECTSLTSITIPDSVPIIGTGAFYGCEALTSISIPDSVTRISEFAFYECISLTSITIPDSVTSIGYGAFGYCDSLTSISIPGNVESIGDMAFICNPALTSITVDTNNKSYTSENGVLFNKNKTAILCYPEGKTDTTYIIPNGVTTIGNSAFYECSALTAITIPDGVSSIGNNSFELCHSLLEIVLPDSVTNIGEYAFSSCSALSSINIPEGVTTIGRRAFRNCTSLTSITFPDSVTNIGDNIFIACENLVITAHCTSIIIEQAYEYNYNLNYIHGNVVDSEAVEPTCTTPGHTAGTRCTLCNRAASGEDEIAPLGHTMDGNTCTTCGLTIYAESEHPYQDNCNETWTITEEDAQSIAVTFSEDTYTEGGCDYITLYSSDGTEFGSYSGSVLAGFTVEIPGDTLIIALTSDGSVTEYGFMVTGVEALDYVVETPVLPIFAYEIQNGEVTITDYMGTESELIIPNEIEGYPVTTINSYAFNYSNTLTEITIPDSVTTIGNYAFAGCQNLSSINLSDNVTYIGYSAFCDCTSLTSIYIPNSVTYIVAETFLCCTSLTSIIVGENNENYCSENGVLFNKDKTELIKYPAGKTDTAYTIPDSVTGIGSSAFYGCNSLTSITIPNSVTSVGSSTFFNCTSLTAINIPDSVTSIGSSAFNSCESLTSITIPNSVTSIGDGAFSWCHSLTITVNCNGYALEYAKTNELKYNILHTMDGNTCTTCGLTIYAESEHPYQDNCNETWTITEEGAQSLSVTFSEETYTEHRNDYITLYSGDGTELGSYSGSALAGFTVEIPGDTLIIALTSDGSVTEYGFSVTGVEALNYIVKKPVLPSFSYSIYNGQVTITDYIGRDTEVAIPNKIKGYPVTCIGPQSFYNCSSLTSITIPESITTIEYEAFYNCSSLTSITIPESVTSINVRVFYQCTSLTAITVDSNNEYYCSADGALFNKDKTLLIQYPAGKTDTACTIPNSVTSIGSYAFNWCYFLTSITIPDSVTSIGSGAFYECTSLTSITIPDSVPIIGTGAFYGCEALTSISIPDSVTRISEFAFYECISLTSITIPDSVTSIGEFAFYECISLTSITIPDSVTSIGEYAFYECTSLTSITIPDSVTSIGNDAFYECTSLTSITIPDSVTSISNGMFSSCTSLKSIIIPDTVTSIDNYAFVGCSSLKSIVIPDSLMSIGYGAFFDGPQKVYYTGTQEEWYNIEHGGSYDETEIVFCVKLLKLDAEKVFTSISGIINYSSDNSSATYQWYGCNKENKSDSIIIRGANDSYFIPSEILRAKSQENKYKYYYCVAYEPVNGVTVRTESPLCTNALSAISESYYSEIDYSQLVIHSDSISNINDFSNIVELGEIQGATFTVTPSHSYGETKAYGTGSKLIISNNEGYETVFDIVVYGDTNGDGVVDVLDVSDISYASTQIYPLSGLYNDAADINGDETVDVLDYQAVVNKALQ